MEDTQYSRRLPRVLNKKDLKKMTEQMVYIGRPSKWGNPFKVKYKDGVEIPFSRTASIIQYEEYLQATSELMSSLNELRNKDLVCFCAPLACHGDVLLRYANRVYCPVCKSLEIVYTSDSPEYVAKYGEEVSSYVHQLFDGTWLYKSWRYRDPWTWLKAPTKELRCINCGEAINVDDYYNSNFNILN